MNQPLGIRQIANGFIVSNNGHEYYHDKFGNVLEAVGAYFKQPIYAKPREVIMEWFDVKYAKPLANGEVHILKRKITSRHPDKLEEVQAKFDYKGTFPADKDGWTITHWAPIERK